MKINRDLGLLLWGNGVSALGTSVYLISVLLLLKDLTESVFLLGLFQFVALIPGFLLSPITGVLVDRSSRRAIIIYADLLRGAVMVAAAGALMVPELRNPAFVLAVSAVVGVGNAFFTPAAQALIPDLVERNALQTANGIRAASNQGFNLAGNALGGALYTLLGAPLVFLLNGLTFFLSAIQETAIRAPRDRVRFRRRSRPESSPTLRREARRLLADVREGLSAALARRSTRIILFSQAGLFLLSPAVLLSLPFIVIDELSYSGTMVGLFFAVSLAGGISVFLSAGRAPVERLLDTPLIPVAYAVLAALFILLATYIHPVTLFLVAFMFGAAAGVIYLYTVTWIQTRNETTMHGRFFSILEAGNSLVAPVSFVLTGLVLEILGAENRFQLFVLLAGFAALWAVWSAMHRSDPQQDTEKSV